MTSAHRDRNPYVFVVGCPRSGTTLLQRMLDAHPQLAVANDTHFIAHAIEAVAPRWRETPSLLASESARLISWSRSYHRFGRLGLPDDTVERAAAVAPDFPAFVRLLYDELASKNGKPYAGDKTPSYVRRLPLLHALFPRARFVHLLRDGRDVALSLLDWATETKGPGRIPLWSDDPIAVCALWWRQRIEVGRADGAKLGPGCYLEVRYEDLVGDPGGELRRGAQFLELPFDHQMVAFNHGKVRERPGRSAKKAWLGPTPGLRDWREQMEAADVELFELLAGETLKAAGYRTGEADDRSAQARERARRARAEWESYWVDRAARRTLVATTASFAEEVPRSG